MQYSFLDLKQLAHQCLRCAFEHVHIQFVQLNLHFQIITPTLTFFGNNLRNLPNNYLILVNTDSFYFLFFILNVLLLFQQLKQPMTESYGKNRYNSKQD